MSQLSTIALVAALKAAAEPTRLRILSLLSENALNVKDLTRILGQSQPRLSRHLRLLTEAGLIDRAPEGSWVYFHLANRQSGLAQQLLAGLDRNDPVLQRDRLRVEAVKREREAAAQTYFAEQAENWDRIRALHISEAEVEAAMRAAVASTSSVELLVDLGTGTGRTLELFADRYQRGIGFDMSHAMLAYARTKLDRAGVSHAQVRHGDIYDVPLPDHVAGIVVMHQILHFLSDPERAINEAARILAPGGKLLIVDFAPHELEFLREVHAHERLGFADQQMQQWLEGAGLTATTTATHLGLRADDGPEKLTVSLWTASLPQHASPATKPKHLERTP